MHRLIKVDHCMLGNCFCHNMIFSNSTFSKKSLRDTSRVSKTGLDSDQDQQNVSPDLRPNCLQRLSADDKSRHEQGKSSLR